MHFSLSVLSRSENQSHHQHETCGFAQGSHLIFFLPLGITGFVTASDEKYPDRQRVSDVVLTFSCYVIPVQALALLALEFPHFETVGYHGNYSVRVLGRKMYPSEVLSAPLWPLLLPPRAVSRAKNEVKWLNNSETCYNATCYLTPCAKHW